MVNLKGIFLALFIAMLVTACTIPQNTPINESIISLTETSTNSTSPTNESDQTQISESSQVSTDIPTQLTPQVQTITLDNVNRLHESGRAFQSSPRRLIWSLDSKSFGVFSDRQVIIFDSQTLTTKAVFAVDEPNMLLDFSPDGKTIAITPDQMSVQIFDINNNQLLHTIEIPEMVYNAKFSPDGRTLAVALYDEIAANLYNIDSGEFLKKLSGFETAAPVYNIFFTPDGRSLIWLARAGVQLMDIGTGELGPAFEHEDFVQGMAVSPDGHILATAASGTVNDAITPFITLWDVSTGAVLGQLTTTVVNSSLSFSPDNHMLAAADASKLIIWDINTRQEVISISGHTENIFSVTFSPDGSTIATASGDNSIRLWRSEP